jgi:hypothetical protein
MKMTQRMVMGLVFLAGLVCFCRPAHADVYTSGNLGSGNAVPTMKTTDDVVSSVPVLSRIPHSFIFGDGYQFKLSGRELLINHMGDHGTPVSQRNCMISLNYASPVAFFGSSVELPLLHLGNNSTWDTSTLGDYVAHFSKDAAYDHPVIGLKITARFF